MKALVYHEPNKYSLTDVPIPKIVDPRDAIGKVTLAAICISDIHTVRGEVSIASYPKIIGHEFCVEIIEVGTAVKGLKPGERCVVIPGVSCGECEMCKSGMVSMCEKGGMFGINGPEGAHAEFVRIPNADRVAIPIPKGLTEEDVLLVPDMLATAWFGAKNARVSEGQSIAVIGCGPVGMCACLLAKKVFGAKQVIAIDTQQNRLDTVLINGVADLGLNPTTGSITKEIMEFTGGKGVDASIETAGIEKTFVMATEITKVRGIVSTVAVYAGPISIPMHKMIAKNLEIKMGIHSGEGIPEMIQMIGEGKIDTRFILTHRAPLNDIEKGYDVFEHQKDGCIKWAITPYER